MTSQWEIIFFLVLRPTTSKKIYLSDSLETTQTLLPFDFWKQLEVPEKVNQNFALILINHYVNNIYSPPIVKDILMKTTLKTQTSHPSPKAWDSWLPPHNPIIVLFWFSLLVLSPCMLSPPVSLIESFAISNLNSHGGILMGSVLSATLSPSTIWENDWPTETVQSNNALLRPLRVFSMANSREATDIYLLELIHSWLLKICAFLTDPAAPAPSTSLSPSLLGHSIRIKNFQLSS